MRKFFLYLAITIGIIGCKQEQGQISAIIAKNDLFEGYAISDQEKIHIERGLKLLLDDIPAEKAVSDTIIKIINLGHAFKAESNTVTVRFKNGIIKDSLDVTIRRNLDDRKRHKIIIVAPEKANYRTVINTADQCIVQTAISSDGLIITDEDPDTYYTLDTFNKNFYNKKREVLMGFRGFKSYSYPLDYTMSLIIYQKENAPYTKTITYNPGGKDELGITPHLVRSGN